jgi:hypothetical protein
MRKFSEALYLVITPYGWVVCGRLDIWSHRCCSPASGDRQLAGMVAGKLFALIGWVGLGLCHVFADFSVARWGAQVFSKRSVLAGDADGLDDNCQPVRHPAADGAVEGRCLAAGSDGKRAARPLCHLARYFQHSLSGAEFAGIVAGRLEHSRAEVISP